MLLLIAALVAPAEGLARPGTSSAGGPEAAAKAKKKKRSCSKKRKKKARKRCRANRKKKKKQPAPAAPAQPAPPAPVLSVGLELPPEALTGRLTPYTGVVTNVTSGVIAGSASLVFDLPPGTSATGLPPGCTIAAGDATCALGDLAPGAAASRTIQVRHASPGIHVTSTGAADAAGDQAASAPRALSVKDLLEVSFSGPLSVSAPATETYTAEIHYPDGPDVGPVTFRLAAQFPAEVVPTAGGSCTSTPLGFGHYFECGPFTLIAGQFLLLDAELSFSSPGAFEVGLTGVTAEGDPVVTETLPVTAS